MLIILFYTKYIPASPSFLGNISLCMSVLIILFYTKYIPGLVFFSRKYFSLHVHFNHSFYTKYFPGLVLFSRRYFFSHIFVFFFHDFVYYSFEYIIYSQPCLLFEENIPLCIFSVLKCFSYFLGNISFCIILLFILLNTKYTPGLVVFFREIFLSAYFPLSSLASGYFGKKMVWQNAKTM